MKQHLLDSFFLAQINPTVGDIAGNMALITDAYDKAEAAGALLAICPECCLIGYPAEDLILFPAFRTKAMHSVQELAAYTKGKKAGLLIGSLWEEYGIIYNAALLLSDGKIQAVVKKASLPNEGVFDEKRIFTAAPLQNVVLWRGYRLGIMVCKDLWEADIIDHLAAQDAEVIIAINASPFEQGKDATRKSKAAYAATQQEIPVVYVNQCGGQDELAFDGGSFVMKAGGELLHQSPFFTSCLTLASAHMKQDIAPLALLYQAMITGLRDYVQKNGFQGVVLGLSGGIDSALTAFVAVDALGAEKVRCVMLPSPYTSDMSLEDALLLAESLGVRYQSITIEPGMQAMQTMLSPLNPAVPNTLAKENIQSRLRGMLLMAISNSTGELLITTGNKSELATGYATLYGDMCGAYSVLKDVYKTEVFALSRWRNAHIPEGSLAPASALMPERIITRPPSAELRENQKDEDSLPAYDVLDGILQRMVEQRQSLEQIVKAGYAAETVHHVYQLLKRAEFKRRQAPIGVKLTQMSFGRDWRMPLTNRY